MDGEIRTQDRNPDQRYWDGALRILQKINPRLVLRKLPLKERLLARFRFWFFTQPALDSWLNRQTSRPTDVAAGLTAPLTRGYWKDKAFEIQLRVLEYSIQVRKAVHGGKLDVDDLPLSPRSDKAGLGPPLKRPNRAVGFYSVGVTVGAFMARIEETSIPSEAEKDIVADYWNKLAFIAWEAAEIQKRKGHKDLSKEWLQRARDYIEMALKGRPNWTPGQLNLARICAAENKSQEALSILERILGEEKQERELTIAKPARESPASGGSLHEEEHVKEIANIIVETVEEKDFVAMAGLIRKGYGSLSRRVVGKVTAALAGKVPVRELHEIFRHITVTSVPEE